MLIGRDKAHVQTVSKLPQLGKLVDSTGVQFLFRQYSQSIGGILADDMGLGKTVQTIAFCAALLGKTGSPEDDITQKIAGGKK